MTTLIRKELVGNWRSFRFPALLLVFLFHALLDPVAVRFMPELLAHFADMELSLPTLAAEDAFLSYLGSISQLGVLVLILVSMGTVAREKNTGVAAWLLSKPVSRWQYLGAKVIVLYAVVIAGLIPASAIAYLYTSVLLGQVSGAGAALAVLSLIGFVLLTASVTFFLSTVLNSPLQAGGVAIVVFIGGGAANMFVQQTILRTVYPNTLLTSLGGLVHGVLGFGDIAWALAVTVGLSVALIALAGIRFSNMEL